MDDKEQLVRQIMMVLQRKGVNFQNVEVKAGILNLLKNYSISKNIGDKKDALKDKVNSFISAKRIDGLSDNTLREYRRQLTAFNNFTNKTVGKIKTEDIRKYIIYLTEERHLKKTTLATAINVLKSFFAWLTVEDILKINPCLKIRNLKIDKKGLRQALSLEEVERLRNSCKTIREKAIIEFFYSTGCRISEIVNISISDINFIERSVDVIGKGSKKRTVYFSIKTKLLLDEYLKDRKSSEDSLFVGIPKPNERLGSRALQQIIRRLGKAAGIKKNVHPHLLRHAFATHALNAGMDIIIIQQLLGHSDVGTTQIYAEISQDNVKSAYYRLFAR